MSDIKVFECKDCGNKCKTSMIYKYSDPQRCLYNVDRDAVNWQETTEYKMVKTEPEPKPDSISFSEVINEMEPGDVFLIDDPAWDNLECFEHESGATMFNTCGVLVNLSVELMQKKGVVVKGEVGVLSAKEMLSKMPDVHVDDYDMIVKYGEAMHQNGRLERDLELRPLLDAVDKFVKDLSNRTYNSVVYDELNDAFLKTFSKKLK